MKVDMQDPSYAAIASTQQTSKLNLPIHTKTSEKPPTGESDQVSIKITSPHYNSATVQRIDNLHSTLNAKAEAIRQTDQNLGIANNIIDKMKQSLEKIQKNYPPFAADSKERQEILMGFSSIKKEILRLTFPPPPPDSNTTVQLPLSAEGKLVTPDLTAHSTDSDINSAWQQLGSISGQISSAREQLASSVKG